MVSPGDFRANRWVNVRTLDTVNHFHAPSDSRLVLTVYALLHIYLINLFIFG